MTARTSTDEGSSKPASEHARKSDENFGITSPADLAQPGQENKDIEKHAPNNEVIERTTTQSSQLSISKARTISLVIVLTGAAFLNTLSVQACVIILPTIGEALDIPAARQQWVISAYSLAFGCCLLAWGRLADVYGKRPIFIWGSAWMSLVTLVAPFIPNEIGFDIFRGLQGLGAAANVPTAIGILGVTFPPGKAKNYAFAMYSAGAPMGSVLGNLVGGTVGQYASWRWVFWVIAILAAVVSIAGRFVIPIPAPTLRNADVKNAVDWPGAFVVTAGLIILLFALTEGNIVGWSTPWVPVLIILGLLLVAVFVLWQLYLEKRPAKRPLMKVTIFKNMRVSAAACIMALFFSSFNNFLVFTTYYFQDYQGLSPIETTVRFVPTGVVGLLTVIIISQLLARVDVSFLMTFGTLCGSISSLLFAVPISPSTTYWAYGFPAMCLAVFGADTITPALLLLTAHSLPKEDQAIGGAMINAVREVGRAMGLAIATAIQVAVQESRSDDPSAAAVVSGKPHSAPLLSGLRAAQWLNFSLGMLAFCIAIVAFRGAGKVGAAKK